MRSLKNRALGRRHRRSYSLENSPFYRLERRADLSALLRLSPAGLADLLRSRHDSYDVREEKIGAKMRLLQVPQGRMRRCHSRIFSLLRRIRLPNYIRSPRIGSTAWENAAFHSASAVITTFDIKDFYPSTTDEHIFKLFRYRFQMSDDCARIMADLCTFRNILPQGSPASPHLACLAHLDLFEEASVECELTNNKISVWVDDIVVSGSTLRRDIVAKIKTKARSKGLQTHKDRRGGGSRGVELTGAFLRNKKLAVANASHKKIRDARRDLDQASSPGERYMLLNRLASMTRYQRTVIKAANGDVSRLNARLQYYKREMNKLEVILSVTEPAISTSKIDYEDGSEAF